MQAQAPQLALAQEREELALAQRSASDAGQATLAPWAHPKALVAAYREPQRVSPARAAGRPGAPAADCAGRVALRVRGPVGRRARQWAGEPGAEAAPGCCVGRGGLPSGLPSWKPGAIWGPRGAVGAAAGLPGAAGRTAPGASRGGRWPSAGRCRSWLSPPGRCSPPWPGRCWLSRRLRCPSGPGASLSPGPAPGGACATTIDGTMSGRPEGWAVTYGAKRINGRAVEAKSRYEFLICPLWRDEYEQRQSALRLLVPVDGFVSFGTRDIKNLRWAVQALRGRILRDAMER